MTVRRLWQALAFGRPQYHDSLLAAVFSNHTCEPPGSGGKCPSFKRHSRLQPSLDEELGYGHTPCTLRFHAASWQWFTFRLNDGF
ncbi:hypothetical protein CBOM_07440 [Ceraceosorus bombacis]|uniref:Uncharacterized protein n=1 Tax=Ceraceosorus bombacis TaxID=401625 RepID=A0A0P1BCN7_9BASI|nr:hypothetical protein CBOM_07440 [Ceraceosorus bombacis]